MKITIAIIVAALLILFLKAIRLILKRVINRYSGLNFINNLIIALEVIIWIGYIFWATDFLFREKFYYEYLVYAMIFIIAGFVAWYLLKDVFAGIIFRVKHNLKTGSYIRAGDLSGQIKSQELTYLRITAGDGQTLRVPYSGIIHEVITELTYPGAFEEHTLHIRTDLSLGSSNTAESLIRTAVLNTAWSNVKEEPVIKYIKETDNGYFFEITLLSVNKKQIKFIEKSLEEIPSVHVVSWQPGVIEN